MTTTTRGGLAQHTTAFSTIQHPKQFGRQLAVQHPNATQPNPTQNRECESIHESNPGFLLCSKAFRNVPSGEKHTLLGGQNEDPCARSSSAWGFVCSVASVGQASTFRSHDSRLAQTHTRIRSGVGKLSRSIPADDMREEI